MSWLAIRARVAARKCGTTEFGLRHTMTKNKSPADLARSLDVRKRKRGKVFTAADSTPIQARIPNAIFLEIERAARHELISIADFVRAALLEKLERERDKNETQ